MSAIVDPQNAFVRAVLHYAQLVHTKGDASPECRKLDAVLRDPARERGASQRAWLRLAVRMAATVKKGGVQSPAVVLDIGAGGLRLRDPGGLAGMRGTRTVVSLRPREGTRIDVPCEVVHQGGDTVGMRFCGPPLVMFERRAA
jgi:hypothetical protein